MIEQKDTERLKFAQQNNWMLPLRGEEVDPIKAQGMKILSGWESAPVYEDLQRNFWQSYFNRFTNAQ